MTPPSKNVLFDVKYAQELFRIAKGDLATAKALIESSNPGRPENILYMIQQAVEKIIKTVLIKKKIAFPLVHDLGILIALLPEQDYPPGGFDLTSMNPFATVRRYEEGALPLSSDEILAAYRAGELIVDWGESY